MELPVSSVSTWPQPRPELAGVSPVAHGALDFGELERLGLHPGEVIDFSVNGNPFGPSPRVIEAMREVVPDRYPDRESLALRRALASRHDCSVERVLVGNGVAELIWLVALAWLGPQRRALIIGPTFGEYERAARLMGASARVWQAAPECDFQIDMAGIERILTRDQPNVVFWCNPNNPTGVFIPDEALTEMAARHPAVLFVIDQAYRRFVFERPESAVAGVSSPPNALILRSMTKDYALAGLRLGYAIGHSEMIHALAAAQPPWSVNAAAQAAGLAALQDEAHLVRALEMLAAARRDLLRDLSRAGLAVQPSSTHYFLVKVGDAARFRHTLLQAGVQVRDCASFGLPAWARVATRQPDDNLRLVEAVRRLWQM